MKMSKLESEDKGKILVYFIAIISLLVVFLPPYERIVYSQSEVEQKDLNAEYEYKYVGCKPGDDITVLDASKLSKEEVRSYDGLYALKIDAKNLEPMGIYRPAAFSSGITGYLKNKVTIFWERMDDAYAQFYLATFADGEKMAILINDRTFRVPSKGEVTLPIANNTIEDAIVRYTKNNGKNKIEEKWIIDTASGLAKSDVMKTFYSIRMYATAILFVGGIIASIVIPIIRKKRNNRVNSYVDVDDLFKE